MDTAEVWQRERPRLIGVAYRITGTLADAEDAVQEAWLRLDGLTDDRRAGIRDVGAWLTTVVANLCIDRLRSITARRERYIGPWLPEPIISPVDATDDPLDEVVRDEQVRIASMVVLQELSPAQRVAVVLHDACGVPFDEVAEILGCSVPAARQHATRGRRALRDAKLPPRSALDEQRAVLEALTAALASGDSEAIAALLHPDVVAIGDGGGKAPAARKPLHGAARVANLLTGLARVYSELTGQLGLARVNGDLALVITGDIVLPGGQRLAGAISVPVVADGRIVAVYNVVNPDKLHGLDRLAAAEEH